MCWCGSDGISTPPLMVEPCHTASGPRVGVLFGSCCRTDPKCHAYRPEVCSRPLPNNSPQCVATFRPSGRAGFVLRGRVLEATAPAQWALGSRPPFHKATRLCLGLPNSQNLLPVCVCGRTLLATSSPMRPVACMHVFSCLRATSSIKMHSAHSWQGSQAAAACMFRGIASRAVRQRQPVGCGS